MDRLTTYDLRWLTPLVYSRVNPYGSSVFTTPPVRPRSAFGRKQGTTAQKPREWDESQWID